MSIKNILLQISEEGGDIIKDIWYLASNKKKVTKYNMSFKS